MITIIYDIHTIYIEYIYDISIIFIQIKTNLYMAKQEGIIKLSGTIDGVNFYFRKGKAVARKAGGGFNGAAIKGSPTMVRVRENNTEFGNCSRVKKVFNDRLQLHFMKRKDSSLHSRMMRLFLDIKDCDEISERGKRSVALGLHTQKGQELLTSFRYTSMPFPVSEMSYDYLTYSLFISKMLERAMLFPNGATHLELTLGIMVFDFDLVSAGFFKSNSVLLTKGSTLDAFTLIPETNPTGNGIALPILFYRYVQNINGTLYPLKDLHTYGLKVLPFLT